MKEIIEEIKKFGYPE